MTRREKLRDQRLMAQAVLNAAFPVDTGEPEKPCLAELLKGLK